MVQPLVKSASSGLVMERFSQFSSKVYEVIMFSLCKARLRKDESTGIFFSKPDKSVIDALDGMFSQHAETLKG